MDRKTLLSAVALISGSLLALVGQPARPSQPNPKAISALPNQQHAGRIAPALLVSPMAISLPAHPIADPPMSADELRKRANSLKSKEEYAQFLREARRVDAVLATDLIVELADRWRREGTAESMKARMELLEAVATLDDAAFCEQLILRIVSGEDDDDSGRRVMTHGGLLLRHHLQKQEGGIARSIEALRHETNPRVALTLIVSLDGIWPRPAGVTDSFFHCYTNTLDLGVRQTLLLKLANQHDDDRYLRLADEALKQDDSPNGRISQAVLLGFARLVKDQPARLPAISERLVNVGTTTSSLALLRATIDWLADRALDDKVRLIVGSRGDADPNPEIRAYLAKVRRVLDRRERERVK
jgi:hypothetical protein